MTAWERLQAERALELLRPLIRPSARPDQQMRQLPALWKSVTAGVVAFPNASMTCSQGVSASSLRVP